MATTMDTWCKCPHPGCAFCADWRGTNPITGWCSSNFEHSLHPFRNARKVNWNPWIEFLNSHIISEFCLNPRLRELNENPWVLDSNLNTPIQFKSITLVRILELSWNHGIQLEFLRSNSFECEDAVWIFEFKFYSRTQLNFTDSVIYGSAIILDHTMLHAISP